MNSSFSYVLVDRNAPVITNRPQYGVYDIFESFIDGTEPRGSVVTWKPLTATDNFGDEHLIFKTGK